MPLKQGACTCGNC